MADREYVVAGPERVNLLDTADQDLIRVRGDTYDRFVLQGDGTSVTGTGSAPPTPSGTSPASGLKAPAGAFVTIPHGTVGTLGTTASRLYAHPVDLPPAAINALAVDLITSATGVGSVLRMGIWQEGADGLPGVLVADSGGTDSTVAAAPLIDALASTVQVGAGRYWLGVVSQGATGEPAIRRTTDARLTFPHTTAVLQVVQYCSVFKSGVTGALPDPFGTPTGFDNSTPLVAVRFG